MNTLPPLPPPSIVLSILCLSASLSTLPGSYPSLQTSSTGCTKVSSSIMLYVQLHNQFVCHVCRVHWMSCSMSNTALQLCMNVCIMYMCLIGCSALLPIQHHGNLCIHAYVCSCPVAPVKDIHQVHVVWCLPSLLRQYR